MGSERERRRGWSKKLFFGWRTSRSSPLFFFFFSCRFACEKSGFFDSDSPNWCIDAAAPNFFFLHGHFFLPAACPPALLTPFPFVSLLSLFVSLFSSVLSLIVLLKPFSHVSRALLLTLSHMDIACIPIRVPSYQSPPLFSRSFPTPNCCFSSQTKKKKMCSRYCVPKMK